MTDILDKVIGRAKRKAIASDILTNFKVRKSRKIQRKIRPKRFGIEKGRVVLKTMKFSKTKPRETMKEMTTKPKTKKQRPISDAKQAGDRSLLMSVNISDQAREWSEWLWNQRIQGRGTQIGLMSDLKKVLKLMYFDLYKYINDKKAQMIPTNTGAMKRSILRSLTVFKANIGEGMLKIQIGTNVPYFPYVHEMATIGTKPHVRHPPHTAKKYKPLINDPKAVKHFLDFIIIEARKEANKIFSRRVSQIIYPKWKSFFGWIRWTQATFLFERVIW